MKTLAALKMRRIVLSILLLLTINVQLSWAQMFQQQFATTLASFSNSNSNNATYINASPTNAQLTYLGSSGAGSVISIASNKLTIARSANGWGFARGSSFSGPPTSLFVRFDYSNTASTGAATSAIVFAVGGGATNGSASTSLTSSDCHSRIAFNCTANANEFVVRDIGGGTNGATTFSGVQTILFAINNSGSTITYKAPDGTFETVANDRFDLWVGTSKQLDERNATTASQSLAFFKAFSTSGVYTVNFANMLIDPIPSIPNSSAATPITSSSFTANWSTVSGVTGYRVDVATDAAFTSLVSGYNNLYVSGQATSSLLVNSGISSSTTYYYRVRAASQYTVDEFASGNSATQNLTTLSASSFPILTTPTATTITENSAVLGANITNDGGASISARGTSYKTSSPVVATDNQAAEGLTATGVYSMTRGSLSAQTQYFYVGYATNTNGTGISSEGNFRTLSNPPTAPVTSLSGTPISSSQIDLTWSAASFPSGAGATQYGYLLVRLNGASPTLVGSPNGLAPASAVATGTIVATTATNNPTLPANTASATGLTTSTTYNFLAVPYTWDGTNAATYNYYTVSAATASATTNAGPPVLTLPTVASITENSAILGATVSANGGSAIIARGTAYKTSSPVVATDNPLAEGGTAVSIYSHTRISLAAETQYFYVGYASNSSATGISAEGSFRTLSNPATVQASSLTATSLTSTSISHTWNAATFPGSGATVKGYVLIRANSPTTPTLSNSNGAAPAAGAGTTIVSSAIGSGATTFTTAGLTVNVTYNFVLIPFTWDGTNATTYNYLTSGAPAASGAPLPTTYTYIGSGTSSWATPGNWTPAGPPGAGDGVLFTGSGALTVTNVPTGITLQKLALSGTGAVTLQSASAGTLSIGGGSAPQLSIASGSTLNLDGSSALALTVITGNTGSIAGNVNYTTSTHTLIAADVSGITFSSPAIFTQGTGCTGNVFGSGTANSVVFGTGTTFIQNAGSNPFQKTAPASVVVFQTGSLFKVQQNNALSVAGRTYANLEINSALFSQSQTGGTAVNIDNLTITLGTLNLNLIGGVNIKGNISVASGQTLTFTPSSSATITFNGTTAQSISNNSGTLTFASNAAVVISNTNGVTFNNNQTVSGSMTVNTGAKLATSAALTLSGTPAINGTFQLNSGGSVTGATLTYGAASSLIYNTGGAVNMALEWPAVNPPFNVTVQNSSDVTMGADRSISGTLTVGVGGILDMTSNQITGTGSVAINGTLETSKAAGFSGSASTTIMNTITSLTLGNASTIDYKSGGSQTITAGNYANLTNSGNGSRTLDNSGTIGISAALTPGSGNYTIGTSTVAFNGSSPQSIPALPVASGANYNNLTLNNSAGATLAANVDIKDALTLSNGAFDVNGKILTLLSTATQTARIAPVTGGSFVGDVTMQRFVPGATAGWATIGMPVTGSTIAAWTDDIVTSGFNGSTTGTGTFISIYSYDETELGLAGSTASYVAVNDVTNSVDPKKGYFVFVADNATTVTDKQLDVTGSPLIGSQNMNVTFSSTGTASEDGWNLLSNPYCSAIDWLSPTWTKVNMDDAIYIYNTDVPQYTGSVGGVSYNGGNELIASSQAFFVHANAASPSLIAQETVKTASSPAFYRSSNASQAGILRLQLDGLNGTYKDETVFRTKIGATSNFDGAFDAYKLYSFDPAAPNISSKMGGIEYVVNAVDELSSNLDLPIRVNVNTPGSYTINFKGLQNFSNVTCFTFEDLLTNTSIDLNVDSSYTFISALDTASASPRFVLHFGVEAIIAGVTPSATTVSLQVNPTVNFANTSTGASNYSWNFGDGSALETSANPSHTYTVAGTYTVTLLATNNAGCSQSTTVTITVNNVTGVNQITASESISLGRDAQGVYANYNFKNSTKVKVVIYNALGAQVSNTQYATVQNSGRLALDTRELAKGIYTFELVFEDKKITQKLDF